MIKSGENRAKQTPRKEGEEVLFPPPLPPSSSSPKMRKKTWLRKICTFRRHRRRLYISHSRPLLSLCLPPTLSRAIPNLVRLQQQTLLTSSSSSSSSPSISTYTDRSRLAAMTRQERQRLTKMHLPLVTHPSGGIRLSPRGPWMQ